MPNDPRKDPRRRCMPIVEWPAHDRVAWEQAIRWGDPFEGAGPAAHWRAGTKKKVAAAYGRWLTFLDFNGELDLRVGPAARVSEERVRAYFEELKSQVAPVTVSGRITDLHEALRVMVPERRFPFLTRAMYTLEGHAKPTRNKRAKYVHPFHLFKQALRILDRIEIELCAREVWRAGRYRDALMIAMLAAWPVRRRNFCSIVIGTNLHKAGERYVLRFEADETKNHLPIEASLAPALSPYMDRYLGTYRPLLLKGRASDSLWISNLGTDMAEISIYFRVRDVTQRELGIALNLHAFRDGPPTSLATDDPAHVGAAMPILGHTDPRIFNKHYNQAKDTEAALRFQENVQDFRRSFATKVRPSPRRRRGREKTM